MAELSPSSWFLGAALLARTAEIHAVDELPTGLDDALFRSPLIEMSRTRGLMSIPGTARYLLDTNEVRVAPEPGSAHEDVRCFLSNTVRALDLLLNGVLCLRAAAIAIDDQVVVICGPSGAGKSVLAAALAQRGHALLADQLVPVVPGPGGTVMWPTDSVVRLWPRAAQRLELHNHPSQLVRPALSKRAYRFGARTACPPSPVKLFVSLAVAASTSAVTARPLDSGLSRVRVLATSQLHAPAVERLFPLAQLDWLAAIGSGVPSISLSRTPWDWTVAELTHEIEEALQ